ncbi:MAG: NIL domain-containing protein [Chloroflexota bacterium]|nr:NIL domain-containing protein [Chloroflexota bacterium]
MTKRRFKMTFPTELITEPMIYDLGRDFRVVTSIRRADITDDKGWVVIDIEGSDEDIDEGLARVVARGVTVDPIDEEIAPSG